MSSSISNSASAVPHFIPASKALACWDEAMFKSLIKFPQLSGHRVSKFRLGYFLDSAFDSSFTPASMTASVPASTSVSEETGLSSISCPTDYSLYSTFYPSDSEIVAHDSKLSSLFEKLSWAQTAEERNKILAQIQKVLDSFYSLQKHVKETP